MSARRLLGKGWGFPLALDGEGGLPVLDGPDKVAESIRLILDTEPGERVMRPTFGCGLRQYLMRANSSATRALIQHDVEVALSSWEPRVQLRSVKVEPCDDPTMVLVQVGYVHVRDGRPGNLVYPFYLQR